MSSISLDETQLATLTPEEQAAIKGDEFSEDEVKALKGIADSGDDDEGDDGDDGDPDEVLDADGKPVETKTDDAPPAKTETKDEPKADDATVEDDPDAAPTRNEYVAKLPDDFDQKIADLATQEAAIRTKFKEGEIELEDYEAQRDAILKERETLNTARVKAEISQEMREQAAQNEWQNQIKTFMSVASKNDGIDYRKDTEKANDLDMFVKTLANSPANADKPGDWFLAEAHKRVMALHGVTKPAAAASETKAPAKTASRESPLKSAPKTLAQVPGGDGPGDVADEFSHLDALEGNDLEAAIAKMTPSQREKFASGR